MERNIEMALEAACVTFCVDTNILVEFKQLAQIVWGEVAPYAQEIRIVVPTTVGEEMDEHKNKTGRLRRRALEFVKVQRSMEESADGRAVVRDCNPRVTIEFDPLYQRSELDANLYDLDDSDGRIVAEVARFMTDHKNAILLADDSKPIRLAQKTGLLWKRPPSSWRREEGPDERDKEIEELRQELGAHPRFSVAFRGATEGQKVYILEPPPAVECTKCSERLATAVVAADRKVTQEESISRYGIEGPFDISLFRDRLTESSLQRYDDDYSKFEERVHRWAQNQTQFFAGLGRLLPINVEVANEGNRAAERVLVELEIEGEFHFLPTGLIADLIEEFLDPPSRSCRGVGWN